MNLAERSIIVLDLETAHSADDCKYCGLGESAHPLQSGRWAFCPGSHDNCFTKIGWNAKRALGLSIGCYYDYRDNRVHWFDVHTLEETVLGFVETQPLLVSFNGISFDGPLMFDCLPQTPDAPNWVVDLRRRSILFENWQQLWKRSYDILAEIWKVDPSSKFKRGLNSLDSIARANGLSGKLLHGAEAPRRWAKGEYAYVMNYCQDDVLKTKALFEQIVETSAILRGGAQPIVLSHPFQMEVL